MSAKGIAFSRREVAQLSGVVVIEIVADDGTIPDAEGRVAIHKEIAKLHHENVLIFVVLNARKASGTGPNGRTARSFPARTSTSMASPATCS